MFQFIVVVILLVTAMNATAQQLPTDLLPPDAKVTKVVGGFGFIEGPVWFGEDGGYLVFSDIPRDELKRWDAKNGVSTFRKPSSNTNGNTRSRDGRLISCEQTNRRIVIREKDGSITNLVDSYEDKKFNSPNDVVEKSDGTIWFTDPPYGVPKGAKREIDEQLVFQFNPATKKLTLVMDDFDMPNGLCFSPDEKRLYIADSGEPHCVRVFDVVDNSLKNGRLFCVIDKGVPDGMRCDEKGNLWSSAGDGVQVFSPEGKLVGKIPVPESPANLCFGGADGKTLFITARTSLYSIRTSVRGAR